MRLRQVNDEVFYSDDQVIRIDDKLTRSLEDKAARNASGRVRLCAHSGEGDAIHEMFIVHCKGTYVRPHKHLNKAESFHVISGRADVVSFNESGDVVGVVKLGDFASGLNYYYRIVEERYHSLIIHSDHFTFHETTKGPFDRADTIFAPWAPDSANAMDVRRFLERVKSVLPDFE